jgi:hypothetical protein
MGLALTRCLAKFSGSPAVSQPCQDVCALVQDTPSYLETPWPRADVAPISNRRLWSARDSCYFQGREQVLELVHDAFLHEESPAEQSRR